MQFVPSVKGQVRMYTCGPTVWNYAHIGNFRTFLSEDLLRRYLVFRGYSVTQVKNLTDVEDRIIEGMKKFGMSLKELTDFYSKAFMDDLATLNIQRAEFFPRATEHIEGMVKLIGTLTEKGYAYAGEDGSIYYDISKFKNYGKLSGIKKADLKSGARVSHDHYEKDEARDFALWKAWDEEDGEVFWETSLGKGRPGWHIECSSMAMTYLGPSFDIHTGGKDLRFPHHENEIAQSEAATGKKYVKYWMHMEFLKIDGEEMHKSLGNMVTLRELLQKGWSPRAVRLFLMSANYREVLNLTDESLTQAQSNISKLDEFVRRLQSVADGKPSASGSKQLRSLTSGLMTDFTSAMDDDLKTPEALAALFKFVRRTNGLIDRNSLTKADVDGILDALRKLDTVFGFMKFEEGEVLSGEQMSLIREREDARKRRDFPKSDQIRDALRKQGVVIEDTPNGTVWKRVSA